jgi:hypothetical protein
MISGVGGSKGVVVESGYTSLPYVNTQGSQFTYDGMIRISGTALQYYNAGCWNNFTTSHATVRLDQETLDVIQWAKTQRTMAMNRLTLAENNPALMKALEKLKKAEDDFEILSKFVEHDNIDKK